MDRLYDLRSARGDCYKRSTLYEILFNAHYLSSVKQMLCIKFFIFTIFTMDIFGYCTMAVELASVCYPVSNNAVLCQQCTKYTLILLLL